MRRLLFAMTAAVAVLAAGMFTTGRADAMTVGSASGVRAAMEDVSAMLDAAYVCRHRFYTSGRRCWWTGGVYFAPRYRFWRHRRWR